MESSNHQIAESLYVYGLEVILMVLLLVAYQGKISILSMLIYPYVVLQNTLSSELT